MSAVVGIDLGTTNTVVAAVQSGRAATLSNERGERLIPSVVSFHPNGSVIVGAEAKARRLQDAKNTVYSTKRLIGRSFGSEEVRKAKARAPFDLLEGPGHGVLVSARGETYTLSEISAFVLREAKRVAEAALNDRVERAVVTVPANFNDLQRAATKIAAQIGGIEVLRVLNEPTAAALAYGYGKASSERIAVYDFGGGTFDFTLLDLAGNVFEVLATAGDMFLGGDDIDQIISERMADVYLKTHRYDPRSDRQVFERLLAASEEVKIALSTRQSVTVELKEIAFGVGGKALDMPFTLTRPELDDMLAPLVDRSLKVCADALSIARLETRAFDQVIVVGGSTRIPFVRKRVGEFFGKKPLDRLSPDEVVALGAGIQASALIGAERRRGAMASVPELPELDPAQRKATHPGLGEGASRSGATKLGPPVAKVASATDESVADFLPLVQPGQASSASGILEEDPTEIRQAIRHAPPPPPPMVRAVPPAPPVVGQTTARLPATPGQTTARMPSAPPLRVPSVPQIGGALVGKVPAGQTTARMASAPPLPLAPQVSPLAAAGAAALGAAVGAGVGASSTMPSATPAIPLLLDVTPLSLAIETVAGYCDVIIERNTPVPCQRTRMFATASDNQTIVRLNVAQGESEQFKDNALLGQLELTGLRAASRGEVHIAVTFQIDSDGILNVSATDTATGHATSARMNLGGAVPAAAELAGMRDRVQRMS